MIKINFITNKKIRNKSGFTLIELLVATSIFVVVMVVGLSTLMSVNSANKKSQALRSAMDNLNFALENMSRNVRYGYDLGCISNTGSINFNQDCHIDISTNNPIPGSSGIVFKLWDSNAMREDYYMYQMNNSSGSSNYVERCIALGGGMTPNFVCAPITSPDLNISTLRFAVYGASSNDGQPGSFVFIEGTAKVGKETSPFKIQTYFTQRQYEQ